MSCLILICVFLITIGIEHLFQTPFCDVYTFLKVCIQFICLFLNRAVTFCYWFIELLYLILKLTPSLMYGLQIFSPFCTLPLHRVLVSFSVQKQFNLGWTCLCSLVYFCFGCTCCQCFIKELTETFNTTNISSFFSPVILLFCISPLSNQIYLSFQSFLFQKSFFFIKQS